MQIARRGEIEPDWTAIGQTSHQLILYHPPSHALTVQPHSIPTNQAVQQPIAGPSRTRQPLLLSYDPTPPPALEELCPYCSQPLPLAENLSREEEHEEPIRSDPKLAKTPYFRILERAHEGSRPPSPRLRNVSLAPSLDGDEDDDLERSRQETSRNGGDDDDREVPSKGYYERFFQEERRLGMGAEGTVFLATHIIGGNILGTYAVKKIAVGESKDYLVRMLREVRLLESLRHPNIIPYHHSWIEPTTFSAFGPPINALHVLMMYATAGNLDTFLLTRSHGLQSNDSASAIADSESLGQLPKMERIKAFRKRRASGLGKKEESRGVLLLGVEEMMSLFGDVVQGLAFLHSNSIVHLDLKCSNVLLHWVEGQLVPKAMISDFGTSEELLLGSRQRTGHTGTMEYMAPETLTLDLKGQWRPTDSHADMWSLGMILHKLLFLHLPYVATTDYVALEAEILRYPGFIPSQNVIDSCERRRIPHSLLLLLSKLVCVDPNTRPTAAKVKIALNTITAEPDRPSKGGAIVQRGFKGLVGAFGGPSEVEPSHPDRNWEDDWQVSPVKSLPLLPTPTSRISAIQSPPPPLRNRPLLPRRATGGIRVLMRKYKYEIRAALFVAKIMSLQGNFIGQKSPSIVFILVLLALWDLRGGSWRSSGVMTIIHIAVMYAVM